MRRQLLLELYEYFENIGAGRSETEEYLYLQLKGELPYFQITTVHRDDLESQGFEISHITDGQMETIASKMADAYTGNDVFWIDLKIIAAYIGIPGKKERYVLVEFPEDASYFEENNIGYPCFNSEDNGARYVSEEEYTKHFQCEPQPNSYFQPVMWPESQEYLFDDDEQIAGLCEPVTADEKALADFGSSSIWVPLCLID